MVLIDLSTSKKLKELVFLCVVSYVQWITMALQTLQSENLQRITLRPYRETFEPASLEWWQGLDRLLVQLQTSGPIRPKVVCEVGEGEITDYVRRLLPELTGRGLVGVAEYVP